MSSQIPTRKRRKIDIQIEEEQHSAVVQSNSKSIVIKDQKITNTQVSDVMLIKKSPQKIVRALNDFVPPSEKQWRNLYVKLRDWRFNYPTSPYTDYIDPAKEQYPSQPPVDTVGCSSLNLDNVPANVRRYQILVSLLLSSQTRDELTAQAIGNLHQLCNKQIGLNISDLLASSEDQVHEAIKMVGFHNVKTKNLIRLSSILASDYDNDIPATAEDMMKLPGIGPKMAYLAMSHAWNNCVGIGVDTHVHRISARFKWSPYKSSSSNINGGELVPKFDDPEVTRACLESFVPQEFWTEINTVLVGHGQVVCLPKASMRKCDICILSSECPSSKLLNSKKIKK
ncbi:hypothetical protein MIR68_012553 [Amoeboaphelidium protococcarum]|nr:hypothetical protein MIR68_012553 [Amoeboaphelidium protococcarum]